MLACFGDSKRVVACCSYDVETAVKQVFGDLLSGREFFLQLKSEEWGGVFIDVMESENIPDKSLLKVTLKPEV